MLLRWVVHLLVSGSIMAFRFSAVDLGARRVMVVMLLMVGRVMSVERMWLPWRGRLGWWWLDGGSKRLTTRPVEPITVVEVMMGERVCLDNSGKGLRNR